MNPPSMDLLDQIRRVFIDIGSAPEYDWLRKLAGGVAGSWYLIKLLGPWIAETIKSWHEKGTVETEQGQVTYEALWRDAAERNISLHVENEGLKDQVTSQAIRIAELESTLKAKTIDERKAPDAIALPKSTEKEGH